MTITPIIPERLAKVEWPGSEPIEMDRHRGIAILRACSFLSEPVRVFDPPSGRWKSERDIARPWGVTDEEAVEAQEILCHRHDFALQSIFRDTTVELLGPSDIPGSDAGWMFEIGDGWTLGPSIEMHGDHRCRVVWHSFFPDGEPLIENASVGEAATAIATRLLAASIAAELNS